MTAQLGGVRGWLTATDTRLAVFTWMAGPAIGLVPLPQDTMIALRTKSGEISRPLALLTRAIH